MALLVNGCQVKTVTPEFLEAQSLDVRPMSNLLKGGMSMVGLGGMCTHPFGYIIIRVQVDGVDDYDEDQIALVIPDLSELTSRVPVILGTLKVRRVINVIKESDLNVLATPWVNSQVTYLLVGHRANTSLTDEKVTNWPMNPINLNEIVKTKKSEDIETFLSKVIHAHTTTMFMGGGNLHVMMHTPYEGGKPLPHGLAVQNTYTEMMTGGKSVALVVRNLTSTPIVLKKNALVARVVAANAVPNA